MSAWNGGKEGLRIGMAWIAVEALYRTDFYNLSKIHDRHIRIDGVPVQTWGLFPKCAVSDKGQIQPPRLVTMLRFFSTTACSDTDFLSN
jgi:hypothetical protein